MFSVIVLNFIIIHSAPGDPVYMLTGGEPGIISPEWLELTRKEFGLDKPLHEQLFIYIKNVLQGNLGYSYGYGRMPVIDLIIQRLPNTLLLMGSILVFETLIGIVLGVISAKKPYSLVDSSVSIISFIGYSIPTFWLGLMFIIFFSLFLKWFPSSGMLSIRENYTGLNYVADLLSHLVLPTLTLGLSGLALITRMTRASMLEELFRDYILTAKSKGLSENAVLFKHALRNALLPVATLVGLNIPHLVSGSVLIETVFSWPGVGRLTYESLYTRDYPILMGVFIIVTITVVLTNLMTDISCAYLDPRIRYS